MHSYRRVFTFLVAAAVTIPAYSGAQQNERRTLGIFTASSDIGVTQPGSTVFDPNTKSYRMSGGGADIWGTADAFSFTWLPITGDATLTADIAFTKPLAYPISKAVLMIRQNIDPGAAYADVAIHGDGHITLQYRSTYGGETKDTVLPAHGPTRSRIVRKGKTFTAYAVSADGHVGTPSSIDIPLQDPVYIGIGVGSHNAKALQTVTFSNVQLQRRLE